MERSYAPSYWTVLMKWLSSTTLLAFCSTAAQALPLQVIDPNSYTAGTDISFINPHVHMYTLIVDNASQGLTTENEKGSVYVAPLAPRFGSEPLPETFAGQDIFGDRVFSAEPDMNPEWWGISFSGEPALVFSFDAPVTYFSILSAEVWGDAGFGNDPVIAAMFGRNNEYLGSTSETIIGEMGCGIGEEFRSCHVLQSSTLLMPQKDVWSIAVMGDSEPTSFGRVEFRIAVVPEPQTLTLICIGMAALVFSRRNMYAPDQLTG